MRRAVSVFLGSLAAAALAAPAIAAEGCPAPAAVEKGIQQVFKRDIGVTAVVPSRVKGLCEVQVTFQGRSNILYTDASGGYFVTGHIIDAKAGVDLTEESLAAINAFSADDMKKVAALAAITLGSKGPVVYFATDPM